jgi:hypothetical protein
MWKADNIYLLESGWTKAATWRAATGGDLA